MKVCDILSEAAEEKKEGSQDKTHKAWDRATDKYHDKQTSKKTEVRMFIKDSTNKKLQSLKDKYGVNQVGEVVDRLVK